MKFKNEKMMTLKEYAKKKSINYHTLKTRLSKKLTLKEVLFEGKFPNNNIYGKDEKGKFIKNIIQNKLETETFRNKPKLSETNRNFPKQTETFRNKPKLSETNRNFPNLSRCKT